MILPPASAAWTVSQVCWVSPHKQSRAGDGRICQFNGRTGSGKIHGRSWKRGIVGACMIPGDKENPNLNLDFFDSAKRTAKSQKLLAVKQLSDELVCRKSELDFVPEKKQNGKPIQMVSTFNSFHGDPLVDKLRTQLGVIHSIPSPPINRNIASLFVFFFFVGVIFDKVWTSRKRNKSSSEARPGIWPQVPTSFSLFLEEDLQRKESVEWVNMVLGKLWKVYRVGLENWIIGLLQPVIDNLKKPDYVQRVELKQFSLGEEPLSVRNVERRTSRRANDLQYQIGLRYTGGARMLLSLSLKFGIIPIVVPVGIRDFDIDGELWVKLRLVPSEPWVGAVSWAFVSLPKIKFELSPFRLFNLMGFGSHIKVTYASIADNTSAIKIVENPVFHERTKHIEADCHYIHRRFEEGLLTLPYVSSQNQITDIFTKEIPVLSMFLTKLLTKDLPCLFVRPKKIVLDFQKGKAVGPVSNYFKTGEMQERNKDFTGELSVTLVDSRKLAYVFYGKTDPYVVLSLGDQVICSKKNSQTTVIGPPGAPIWNQDFHMLVSDPKKQTLSVQAKESFGFMDFTLGTGEVELGSLQDTVPTDKIIVLRGGWGLFRKGSSGEILLRLTYKAYVEDEEDDGTEMEYVDSDVTDEDILDSEETDGSFEPTERDLSNQVERELFMDVLAALIVSEEFQGIVASETGSVKLSEEVKGQEPSVPEPLSSSTKAIAPDSLSSSEGLEGSAIFWLAVIASVAMLVAVSMGCSSIFNP